MLSPQQLSGYLARLHHGGSVAPNLATLQTLHRLHMRRLPFENLDIFLGREIALGRDALYAKLIVAKRGGFCYELNYLFCVLLRTLGFKVQMLSAQVFNGQQLSAPFDHLLLLVILDDEKWVADVGFGDSFDQAMQLDGPALVRAGARYTIEQDGARYTLRRQLGDADVLPQYQFTLEPRGIEAFHERCAWQQSSPDSHFTRTAVCSIATEQGRISLSKRRLISTTAGKRRERSIASETQWRALLQRHFGVSLNPSIALDWLVR